MPIGTHSWPLKLSLLPSCGLEPSRRICARGELRRQGKRVKLQEQPFHVLTILLQRAGEVVTREELRSVKARAVFQDFLALWKAADADIPILKEARAEYDKLQ